MVTGRANLPAPYRYQPLRTILVNYELREAAHTAWTTLNRTRIGNTILTCIVAPSEVNGRSSLKIVDVPNKRSDDDIFSKLPPHLRPEKKNVSHAESLLWRWHKPSNTVISNVVARLTDRRPTDIQDTTSSHTSERRIKLKFGDSRGLDHSTKILDGKRLSEFGPFQVRASESVTLQLNLNASFYERYRGLFKSCAHRIWQMGKVMVHIDEDTGTLSDHVRMSLSSSRLSHIIAAKDAFDKIVIELIAKQLTPQPPPIKQTHRIPLGKTTDYMKVVALGNLEKAQDRFGQGVVDLNGHSDPPAILIKGDTSILRAVQRFLFPERSFNSKKQDCAICWDKSDEFIKIEACGHVACKDCFVQYCTTSNDAKFPLRCFGTECHALLALDQLRLTLGEAAFHRLLSEAIDEHFRQHPAERIKCPGADCTLYTPSASQTPHNCPGCLTAPCTACRAEYHFGETCAAYKARTTDNLEELATWMREAGAKECPRCRGLIEKREGCNNMTCGYCKQDFCFVCLAAFDSHAEVYDHLSRKHDGFYDHEEEAARANERLLRQYREAGGWREEGEPVHPDAAREPVLELDAAARRLRHREEQVFRDEAQWHPLRNQRLNERLLRQRAQEIWAGWPENANRGLREIVDEQQALLGDVEGRQARLNVPPPPPGPIVDGIHANIDAIREGLVRVDDLLRRGLDGVEQEAAAAAPVNGFQRAARVVEEVAAQFLQAVGTVEHVEDVDNARPAPQNPEGQDDGRA